jgi:hypothetical protein
MSDDMRDEKIDEPPAEPVTLLSSAALQWAWWKIRKVNRQARQVNGGVRVPLDSPLNKL